MENELPIPLTIEDSEKSMEMVRIWIADNEQHVILTPNLWDDPGAWGLMLVDLARHVSKAYAQSGNDEAVVLQRIKEAFDVEWDNPTE